MSASGSSIAAKVARLFGGSRATGARAQRPIILAYHRIVEPDIDPWGLAVAPDRFQEQLAVLRETREPFAMSAFLDRLERGNLPANAVAVTFDDGYVDNLTAAKPRLERAGIPAAVFIATGYVGATREFWWDELARLILEFPSAIDCEVAVGGKRQRLTLRALAEARTPWTDWRHPRTEREQAYIEMWGHLRSLTSARRDEALAALRAVLESGPAAANDLPMRAEEIAALASGGSIEIGAHSQTHPVLTALPPEDMRREIAISKSECERLIGRPVEGFAYPHGAHDEATCASVREEGFRFACAIKNRSIDADRFDNLALPRLKVLNWTAEAFERAMAALEARDGKPKRGVASRR
ncbi:MAG: polysaccharide deacetylase family protein [Methyloceanibacter sp.]